jgi:hypothetical protein
VRIQRDEARYPSKGTWPRFHGRTGSIVEINVDRKRPHLTKYGVSFNAVRVRTDGRGEVDWRATDVAWFKVYEIVRAAAERHAERLSVSPEGKDIQDAAAEIAAA